MSLFDSISKKITQTGQDALNKTKNVAETVKLSALVSDAVKDLDALYLELGRLYFEKYEGGEFDVDFAGVFSRIKSLKSEIAENNEKIREFKGVSVCTNCGAEGANDMQFCGQCGEKLDHKEEAAQDDVNKCKKCDSELEANAKFCIMCGEKAE